MIKGLSHLFDNEFMTAKAIFEAKADWYAKLREKKIVKIFIEQTL